MKFNYNTFLFMIFSISVSVSCGGNNKSNNRSSMLSNKLANDISHISSLIEEVKNQEDIFYINDKLEALELVYSDSLVAVYNGEVKQLERSLKKIKELNYKDVFSKEGIFSNGSSYEKSFYGLSKDTIRITFKADKEIRSFRVIEEKSGRDVKKAWTSKVDFNFEIFYDNPYTVLIEFRSETYFDLNISRKSANLDNKFATCQLIRDSVIIDKKTKRSLKGTQMVQTKVFNDPKKFVVSKSFSLSGEPKVYAPVELPKNTIEFIYTLRVSGNSDKLSEDGSLFNQIDRSYKKVKFLGIPLWESEGEETSITREILNSLVKPKKDEDYTLNVFFFNKENEIKKFLNYSGKDYSSAFAYDINNSAISTQSRIGLIKKPRSGFSYIGLQTNSTFSDTYAWLDVVALSEKSFYYEIRYKLERN